MNNTKKTKRTLTIVAVLMAAALVVGTFATTTATTKTAFAASNNSGNTVTAHINSQSGTQSGFDNTQEQEGQNTICTHPESGASCVSDGAAAVVVTPTTPIKTCEQCFTSLLTQAQINFVVGVFGDVGTLARLCEALQNTAIDEVSLQEALSDAGVSETTATELIACLLKAGIVFRVD